jgi:hypothetical protein
MNKDDIELGVINFFSKTGIASSAHCSKICGVDRYEKILCEIEKPESLDGMNYQMALNCLERCLNKNLESSILGFTKFVEVTKI